MSSCIFFFPNCLLNSETDGKFLDAVPDKFRDFVKGTEEPTHGRLFEIPELSGYASAQWMWMRISGLQTFLEYAPYLWRGHGEHNLGKQLWHLAPYRLASGILACEELQLDEDGECYLRDLLYPLLQKHGLNLQLTPKGLFATRSNPWNLTVNPWYSQEGKSLSEADGPDAGEWKRLDAAIREALPGSSFNEWRAEKGLNPIAGFWISGGGTEPRQPEMSKVRCLLSSDPLYQGIANVCGISKNFIRPVNNAWPGCPPGDRIVSFEEPGKVLKAGDVEGWRKALERAADIMVALTAGLEPEEPYEILMVATGPEVVSAAKVTVSKSKLAFWKKNLNNCRAWLAP